jgi:CBS domain-containing protein
MSAQAAGREPEQTGHVSTASVTAGELMRHGIVLCDSTTSLRGVARVMRDRGVSAVLVIDLDAESMGLVDERALLEGWRDPDRITAGDVMDRESFVVDPATHIDEAARLLLSRGLSQALVAPPPPSEESGQWSEWKERGLPRGTVSALDIFMRSEELYPAGRSATARLGPTGIRRAPALVLLGTLLAIVIVLVGVLLLSGIGRHPQTCNPQQVAAGASNCGSPGTPPSVP